MAKIAIERNVEMKTRDGCALRSDVYRPDDDERHPVLLARTPYGKETQNAMSQIISLYAAVAVGYVMVIQDVRGTGSSDGDGFFPHRDEGADGYDAIEWSAALPWSNGEVGVLGLSYLAGTAWQAAAEAPPSLRAIVGIQGARNFYDIWWRGGALRITDLVGWTLRNSVHRAATRTGSSTFEIQDLVDALDDIDSCVRHTPMTSFPLAQHENPDFVPFFQTLEHPAPDEWTRSIMLCDGLNKVRVPALVVAGWHDRLLSSDLRLYSEMRRDAATAVARDHTRLIVGPWSHGDMASRLGEVDFGYRAAGATIDLTESLIGLQFKWFDRWLRGTDSETFETPRVWLFVQGANLWRHFEDWPVPGATPTTWYLGPGGRLGSVAPPSECPPDTYFYDPSDPCPTRGGASLLLPARYPIGPVDQLPVLQRRDVVSFTSEPLDIDLEVIGTPIVTVYASTSAPDTDWVVKLCDVHPDGRSVSVTDGVLRARYRRGLHTPALVQPGAVERYNIELDPTAMMFRSGHRLQVIITSSDFPRYDRNPNTGEISVDSKEFTPALQQIFHDASHPSKLVLPIIGSKSLH
ncbi:CocE/NonD family hydrolase [Nocardia africana]|uniref:CocE/NonD family hydrolase n=1 Tax=Nocardia africana TaxID=134964 RepID=A0ABW6NUF6_9NOCA